MQPSNILKINTLTNAWADKDLILLHASFQLLTDCIEKENLLDCHADWAVDDNTINAKAKIEDLYRWWQNRKMIDTDLNEVQYYEDNEMLKRLIDVRKYLWT
jgi:hypothetical protein